MLAAAAFIIFFLVVAGAVLFFAFGGGPRSAAENLNAPGTRTGRRVTGLVIGAIVLAFGVAIPVLAMTHNNRSQSKQAAGGLDLTASEKKGREIFAHNCATCHTLGAANSVGKVGPNLDQLRPPSALVVNAIQKGRARGMGQMPAGLVTGNDVNLVAKFVSVAAGY